MDEIDLEYEPGSTVGSLDPQRVSDFERWLSHWREQPTKLPSTYVQHLVRFHGGVPGKKCFRMPDGRVRVVGRFLNFLEPQDLPPAIKSSWRGGGGDERLDYSLDAVGPASPLNSNVLGDLMPFAGLDTAGQDCRTMAVFNLLCFDYASSSPVDGPPIVAWDRPEKTLPLWQGDRTGPEVGFVARSFDAFLTMLFRCPAGHGLATERKVTF